jgi:hypothetical protein
MKTMGTQLGSWAQARHDNILYIEQLGRFVYGCEYPGIPLNVPPLPPSPKVCGP